ncbi:MAG: transporter suffix domain-containing protein [Verrucomicrobiota bacterium]
MRIGIVLIVLSCVLWFSLFAIPFLPLTVAQKTGVGAAVFVAVQIAWWSGAALTGPGVVRKMKAWFVKWRKPKN